MKDSTQKTSSTRLLVCGDRHWDDRSLIFLFLSRAQFNGVTTIIEGECRGADLLAREAAERLGLKVLPFPALWTVHGTAAGPIRNLKMLDEGKPHEVFAFHDCIEKSIGTKNMVNQAESRGIPVTIISHSKVEVVKAVGFDI